MRIASSFLGCIFVFFAQTLFADASCFFCPPDQWMPANASLLSPRVKVGFIGPPSALGFCPSVNLAEENVQCSLQDYLNAVKKIHTSTRHKEWSYLGTFQTAAGAAALTQIDLPSQHGPMRLLQLILIKDKVAYILTGACLKKEILQYLPIFRETFHSLQVTHDLYSMVKDEKKHEKMRLHEEELEIAVRAAKAISMDMHEWQRYQNFMIEQFAELGPYWQALAIAQTFKRLQGISAMEKEVASIAFPDLHFFLKPLYYMVFADIETARRTYEKMDCFGYCDFDDTEPLPPLLRR